MYKRAHKNNAFDLAISATRPSLRRALPILADPGQQEAVIIAAWLVGIRLTCIHDCTFYCLDCDP